MYFNPFCSRSKGGGGGGSKKEGGSKIKEGAPPSYVALATTLQTIAFQCMNGREVHTVR